MTEVRRWNLKRLGPQNISEVPDVCGAYVLFNRDGEAQYVGESCRLGTRLEEHEREGSIPDARYFMAYQTSSMKEAKTLERKLFRRYKPWYNRKEP